MDIAPILVGVEGVHLTQNERALFSERAPFSVILFGRNIERPDQVTALCQDILEVTNGQTIISIDQEGGRVQRMKPPFWHAYPSPLSLAEASRGDLDALARRVSVFYALILDDLRRSGLGMNFAPCLDMAFAQTHPFLKNRCFGSTFDEVVTAGRVAVDTHIANGVLPVIKHMPGHGAADADSHKTTPEIHRAGWDAWHDLLPDDMRVFTKFCDAPLAMTAHIVMPEIDAQRPLTLSETGIRFLRERIGFKGVLMSDDLGMNAISGRPVDRVREAFAVSLDLAMFCSGDWADNKEIMSVDVALNAQTRADLLKLRDDSKSDLPFLSDADRRTLWAELVTGLDVKSTVDFPLVA